ncbi:MAG TPA: hypothetical protein VF855_14325 [Acidimicrobiales bacterium]
MATRFRDRFFTPKVARAITSPSGIVVAGVGAAIGIVAGLPIIAAAAIGVAGWVGRVALAVPRAKKGPRIEPFALNDPWRGFVRGALEARARFDRSVAGMRPGPMRDKLGGVADRVQQGVEECWRIASRGDDIDQALASLETNQARNDLAQLLARRQLEPNASANTQQTIEALQAQLASADRLAQVSADARDRLRLLDARLDELVARAVELSIGATDADVGLLDADVDGLVTEMEALRQAVEEANRPGPSRRALPGT